MALCIPIAAVALGVGAVAPLVGSALPAVLIGFLVATIRRPAASFTPGIRFSGSTLLQVAVVLLGTRLSLRDVVEVGTESLPVMLSTLTVCLLAALWIGRALGVPGRLRTLIGVGTGICGGSAIAAVAPVIAATSGEIAYAISTIFVFNVLGAVAFPLIGHALGLDPHTFGLLAGTAINDTSSVVAAAGAFGASALGFAIIVKLVRTLMIVPITLGLSILRAREGGEGAGSLLRRPHRLVPWFIVGFVLAVALNSAGLVPPVAGEVCAAVSGVLIALALAGIGLSTDFAAIRSAGWKPLGLGAILSVLVAGTAVIALIATGRIG